MNLKPPKLARRLLDAFLRDDLAEEVNGDLQEEFYLQLKKNGRLRAKLYYWYEVIHYLRPFAMRKSRSRTSNPYAMYQNYFKIAFRKLFKSKGYSMINIGGLAVGMAVAVLIGLWINDEFSYDTYHKNYDRIAQVMQHQIINGYKGTDNSIPMPLVTELQKLYAGDFKYLVMASWGGAHVLNFGEKNISKTGNYMDVDVARMLSLKMLSGNWDGLKEPGSILLSESTAKALFGDNEALGQLLKIDNKLDVKVTGVYEDLPHNTTLNDLAFIAPFELYVSSEQWVKTARDNSEWGNNSFQLFAQIADNAEMNLVGAKIQNTKYNRVGVEEKVYKAEIFLHPMKDWRLRSNWEAGVLSGGFIQYVWLFGIVGAFVLLLACINFMNLSTARSEQSAKEVGIRKSIGSARRQLITQFLSESFLVVVIAFVLALAIVYLVMPSFNQLADKKMVPPLANVSFWVVSLGFIAVTGFLAGSYPALYLSSFQPVKVLKGASHTGRFGSIPRKVLVVLQFTVSVTLIIGTIVVYQQIQYSKNRPIGYSKNGIVMIQMRSPEYAGKYDMIRNELKNTGAVDEMSESSSPMTEVWSNNGGFRWDGKDPNLQADFATIWISHDYGKTVGWEITQGRDYSRDYSTDSSGLIINEAAVKFMGLEKPLGKIIHWGDDVHGKDFKIIGVVKDLLMQSPFKAVKQTIYVIGYNNLNWIEFKLNPLRSVSESLASAEGVFKKLIPNEPFDYRFADQEYATKFAAEERIGKLSTIFSGLAIFISCLGLFALSSFMAEKRTKEIGIRKVLGASVANLWQMLSRDFVVLVIISCASAAPIAYYLMAQWLTKYDYHTEISWLIFVWTAIGALAITLLTVSYQAIRAALMNPVNSLRSE